MASEKFEHSTAFEDVSAFYKNSNEDSAAEGKEDTQNGKWGNKYGSFGQHALFTLLDFVLIQQILFCFILFIALFTARDKLQEIINLPAPVICCLAALLKYLEEFKLHRVLKEAR